MRALELLAPARTAEIGIAAIDCGADAVYIAGQAFGARAAAGNSVDAIARLCEHAHRFGARIYATVNTIVYQDELPQVQTLVRELKDAGVDALIVQDPVITQMCPDMILHASTQCAVRTPQKARFIQSLGYGRLVLERQLSLEEIRAIRQEVDAELEFFVHGSLCVCYSGECYLSEYLTGRSANRGACAQPCRSLYNLTTGDGKTILKNAAALSLKDYRLYGRLGELAQAGVCSFKIEGRLKGMSYVKNVVRAYSDALDALVEAHPEEYRRSSFGKVSGGFTPNLDKTFNRGYTELFIDGTRGRWASMDSPKSMGEYIGTVERLTADGFILSPAGKDISLSNGDGLAFRGGDGEILGVRADVCEGYRIRCKKVGGLSPGTKLYRNISAAFEKEISASNPVRLISVGVKASVGDGVFRAEAVSEDGRTVRVEEQAPETVANMQERMLRTIRGQIGKRTSHYSFNLEEFKCEDAPLPLMSAAFLNGIRRSLAQELDRIPPRPLPLMEGRVEEDVKAPGELDYKANVASREHERLLRSRGATGIEQAYELTHRKDAELMRTRYCLRHELGLCPKIKPGTVPEPLYLENGRKRLRLDFLCASCEMTVREA